MIDDGSINRLSRCYRCGGLTCWSRGGDTPLHAPAGALPPPLSYQPGLRLLEALLPVLHAEMHPLPAPAASVPSKRPINERNSDRLLYREDQWNFKIFWRGCVHRIDLITLHSCVINPPLGSIDALGGDASLPSG